MNEQNTDVKSLAHTKWNCKYHVVFAQKYRRKVFFQEKREDIREIIKTLCQWKGVDIICYQAHYNKLIFHFSCKIKEVLA